MSSQLSQFILPRRLERMEEVLAKRTEQLTIVLDRIHHEHNISAVLRSADAFGIQTVYFTGERFKSNKGISLGSDRWLDVECFEEEAPLLKVLRKKGYKLVILQPKEYAGTLEALPVGELPFQEKLALVFGSEKHGVSEGLKSAGDLSAHIEMHGFVESFNISVACALSLYSARESTAKLEPLEETRKNEILDKWTREDVREAEKIEAELKKRK